MKLTIMTNLVSIMMPAYNSEQYIALAIESVLAQGYPEWELVVVNDGSTDATAEIVAKYSDPRIKLINQENGGEASARNAALDHMQGELVAFLDADDLYLPDHLEQTIGYLKTHSDKDGVYTDGYHCDQDGKRMHSLSSRRRGPFEGRVFEQLVRASDVFGPPVCLVLRRNLIDEHDLRYDPRIVIGPDWDFNTRYAQYAEFGYLDEFTCLYRIHQTNISIRTTRMKRLESLALCREKAIKLPGSTSLSMETRQYVFYDLLINLLTGFPERQVEVTQWQEFRALSQVEQARLYRLMASETILNGSNERFVEGWFQASRQLNKNDARARILFELYKIHPAFCRSALRMWNFRKPKQETIPLLENMA